MRPAAFALFLCFAATAQAEILIRWDQDQLPSPTSLGISTVVVPAGNTAAVQDALRQGYRLFLEGDASSLAGVSFPPQRLAGVVLRGNASPLQRRQLRQRLGSPGARVLDLEDRGKWPHIRSNWVTRNKDVLQVSARSAQPWLENNAALLRIGRAADSASPRVVSYVWTPITLSDIDEGPAVENYLVAIAETGSFGRDLLLPLHQRFQTELLLGVPAARATWNEIRRYIEFYSWDLPGRYQPIANIAVVTGDPMQWYELMNLLVRHNLPFELVHAERVPGVDLSPFDLLIVPDAPKEPQIQTFSEFARKGGTVVFTNARGTLPWRNAAPVVQTDERASYRIGEGQVVEVLKGTGDPNTFALGVRQMLPPDRRVIEIWNGITVLAAPYQKPGGKSVLVTAVNYAHQLLPVQVRVRGTFSMVHYESPEQPLELLPYEHRDGYTEFVVPALRIGGRIFLSQ